MMKTIAILLLAAFIALGGLVLATAQNSDEEATPVILNKSLGISIGVVALLLAAATGYGIAYQTLRGHIANKSIHHSERGLDDRFVLRTEIEDLKENITRQFDDLKTMLKNNRGGEST